MSQLQGRSQNVARQCALAISHASSCLSSRISRWKQIHPWAKAASIAGRCIYHQSPTAFWKYHDWIYDHQGEINPDNLKTQVMDFAKTAQDVDGLQLGRCIDTKATEAEVDASIAEGHALHVDATPTLFLNGRRLVGNYPWQNHQPDHQRRAQLSEDRAEHCLQSRKPMTSVAN